MHFCSAVFKSESFMSSTKYFGRGPSCAAFVAICDARLASSLMTEVGMTAEAAIVHVSSNTALRMLPPIDPEMLRIIE